MTNQIKWVWFSSLKISAGKKAKLMDGLLTPDNIMSAPDALLLGAGLSYPELNSIKYPDLTGAKRILDQCQERGIKILTMDEEDYPERLLNIQRPPAVLYYKGNFPDCDNLPLVAVVGSRSHTLYGKIVAERMGYEISRGGGHVVSGLAKGLDAEAHRGALRAHERTTAVLGCGPDIVYPNQNDRLFGEILAGGGCIVSEYPPGTPPYASNFPERNRIVSGMSLGVLVVEAAHRSGALITANIAADQGRDVFAVPGNIDVPESAGTNDLIKSGAKLVTSGWDVLAEYVNRFPDRIFEPGESRNPNKTKKVFTEAQQNIIVCLADGAKHLDLIIGRCGLSASEALSELMLLELEGAVSRLPGNIFAASQAINIYK